MYGRVAELADARGSEPRVPYGTWECNSPLGHLIVRGVDWRQDPARSHKPSHVGSNPTSATRFFRTAQCPAAAHNRRRPGATPRVRDCLSAEYANRQSDQVENLVIDCGFDSRLGYWCCRVVSGRTGKTGAGTAPTVAWPPTYASLTGSAGVAAAHPFGRGEDRVRSPGGPTVRSMGAHVPWGRVCFASRLRWVQSPSSPLDSQGSRSTAHCRSGVPQMRV
jgi:hypothetical protein